MRRCVAGAVAIVLSGLAEVAPGQSASITGLGDLPGGHFRSSGYDISDDGMVIVGDSSVDDSFSSSRAFRWTRKGGMVNLGKLTTQYGYSTGLGVSPNGEWVVGASHSDSGFEAFRWSGSTGMQGLGDLAGGPFNSYANAINTDGTVVGGQSMYLDNRQQATRWTAQTGTVGLGFVGGAGARNSAVAAMTSDGVLMVGESTSDKGNEAFVWTEQTGMVGLGALDEAFWSSAAKDVSDDGRVIVGESYLEGKRTAFRWTQEAGMVPISPVGLGSARASARAVSADGSVIVGWAQYRDTFAFIWTEAGGFERLDDYLLSHGLDLKAMGWSISEANAITPDGRFIVVNGRNPNGDVEGAVIEIPAPGTGAIVGLGALAGLRRGSRRRR